MLDHSFYHQSRYEVRVTGYTSRNDFGFALFEVIISLALLLIIVGGLGGFVVAIHNSRAALSHLQEVDSNMMFAFSTMSMRIRSARAVNSATSTFSSDPGVLSLDMPNPSVNPTVFRLDQDNGTLLMQEGAAAALPLTTSAVSVSQLIFSLRAPAGEPENIGILLTVDSASAGDSYASFSHTATTSVTTRQ